ncbi:MAG: DUF1016 family protein [Calditrichaceae bacterium]|nr:PDDEXK nuclease domain-containing protein [Calditrichia bacterium]NUQ40672.1 DUF1016 family protein [Calditrichaceae bacterium]
MANKFELLFKEFIDSYDSEKYDLIWAQHSLKFKSFWNEKIVQGKELSEAEIDPIVRMIDIKAKGFNKKTDEAAALVGLRQGVWYRIFKDLKIKTNIRDILNQIFNTDQDQKLIDLINSLAKENQTYKNGLTGANATALNALLFINNPGKYISSVSLRHRIQIINSFNLGSIEAYKDYGEKIIISNNAIVNGISNLINQQVSPRTISNFLYSDQIKSKWKKELEQVDEDEDITDEERLSEENYHFVIEKHLEDFLVVNWESTVLGQKYELIQEDGELRSQQYKTDIGKIDLLVQEKKTGNYVVIELKKGQTSDDTVGQLTRYMGWVKEKLAQNALVKGIIIAASSDDRLRFSLKMVPNTEIYTYKLNFSLEKSD